MKWNAPVSLWRCVQWYWQDDQLVHLLHRVFTLITHDFLQGFYCIMSQWHFSFSKIFDLTIPVITLKFICLAHSASLRVLPEIKSTPVDLKQEPPRRAPSPTRPPPDGQSSLLCLLLCCCHRRFCIRILPLTWLCLPPSDSSDSDQLSHLRRSGSSERGERHHRYRRRCSTKWYASQNIHTTPPPTLNPTIHHHHIHNWQL